MSQNKNTCPQCFTRMNHLGDELVCPVCGYKYCDHRYANGDIFNTSSHEHNDHVSYTTVTTYNPPTKTTASTVSGPTTARSNPTRAKKKNKLGFFLFLIIMVIVGLLSSEDEESDSPLNDFIHDIKNEFSSENTSEDDAYTYDNNDYSDNTFDNDSHNAIFHSPYALGDDINSKLIDEFLDYGMSETGLTREELISQIDYIYARNTYEGYDGTEPLSLYCSLDDYTDFTFQSDVYNNFNRADLYQFENIAYLYLDGISYTAEDLAHFPNLQGIICSNSPAELSTMIQNPDILTTISLSLPSGCTTLDGLSTFKYLYYLEIDSNELTDISDLANMTSLECLYMYTYVFKADTDCLKNLTCLTELGLDLPGIENINFISSMPNLTYLALNSISTSNLSPIGRLTSLTDLSITRNSSTEADYSCIKNLKNLLHLDLSFDNLTNISFVSNLTNLERIKLSENQIKDFSPLYSLTSLESVICDSNEADVSAYEALVEALPNTSVEY